LVWVGRWVEHCQQLFYTFYCFIKLCQCQNDKSLKDTHLSIICQLQLMTDT
jgi:hypothetical protein